MLISGKAMKRPIKLLDPDIREILFTHIESQYAKIRFMDEVKIGHSRADALVITDGYITGFEIKSDGDSFFRLKLQVGNYNKYCDYCNVVIGQSHINHIENHVPPFWGIIVISKTGKKTKLEVLRRATLNPEIQIVNKMGLLWGRELRNILSKHNLSKHKSKRKRDMIKTLVGLIPTDVLSLDITDELFERDYTL
jgi:hypothetical protein